MHVKFSGIVEPLFLYHPCTFQVCIPLPVVLWISKGAKSGVWAVHVSSQMRLRISNNPEKFICSPSQLFFECLGMCAPAHAILIFVTEALYLVAYVRLFSKWLWKWSNGLYSASLLLMGWFLWCTTVLGPRPLLIPTIAAIKSCRTCLASHVGFISSHIMPLASISLGGRHTQHTSRAISISRNQACQPTASTSLV